ncbi:TraB/GumN family protein [Luteimonas sp. S4-F44]|uniref:TraB/GumN family protein n=1 Tax=Luteimonas sp. S4-F44 TaxID=2925842 RepID=UPI001F532BDB|nr:TraB/GumN family protein [Luteimonas sp. S4-F44]UNK43532.1 TraB/GumN family protein [Luteimonas sp. S4-F44]
MRLLPVLRAARVAALAFVFLGLAPTAWAQSPAAVDEVAPSAVPHIAEVPAPAPPVPLLWKVSGDHGALYLLGSFHFLQPADYPLSEDVARTLAAAGEVVFELSPEELESPTLAMQMMQAGLRSDGSRLDDDLPPALAADLAAWGQANLAAQPTGGMSAQSLQLFKPWFASLLVTTTELGRYGLQAQLGMDAYLARQAREAGKATAGLETASEQIGFLDGLGQVEQVEMLREALDQAQGGQASIETLHGAWRAGDAAQLWNGMALDMRARFPALYRRINTERNDAWLPKLEQMLQQDGEILVVVGTLHLLGEDGVVEKLAAKGYEVERICSACAPPPTIEIGDGTAPLPEERTPASSPMTAPKDEAPVPPADADDAPPPQPDLPARDPAPPER